MGGKLLEGAQFRPSHLAVCTLGPGLYPLPSSISNQQKNETFYRNVDPIKKPQSKVTITFFAWLYIQWSALLDIYLLETNLGS